MKLIAGLGNPGKEYAETRHNSGFMAIDCLAAKAGVSITSEKWNALTAVCRIEGQPVLLMKPLTYMNNSGSAVSQAVNFYKMMIWICRSVRYGSAKREAAAARRE